MKRIIAALILISATGLFFMGSHHAHAQRSEILARIQIQLNRTRDRALALREIVLRLAISELEKRVAELRAQLVLLRNEQQNNQQTPPPIESLPVASPTPPPPTTQLPDVTTGATIGSDEDIILPSDPLDDNDESITFPFESPAPESVEEAQAVFSSDAVIAPANISTIPLRTSATIRWETTLPATSILYYFLGSEIDASENPDDVLPVEQISKTETTREHAITINNLEPGTKYYYLIASIDTAGQFISQGNLFFNTLP